MRLINKKALEKLKRKNRGNVSLSAAIDKLINDIEGSKWHSQSELKKERPDADRVHREGFYFFNIYIYIGRWSLLNLMIKRHRLYG